MRKLESKIVDLLDLDKSRFNEDGSIATAVIRDGVTVVPDNAFFFQSNLESVFLPDSLKTIQHDAFNSCYRLRKIKLQNIEYIGIGAFDNCNFRQYTNRYFTVQQKSDPITESGCGILVVNKKPSLCFSDEYGKVSSLLFLEVTPTNSISASPYCSTRFYIDKWSIKKEYSFCEFVSLLQSDFTDVKNPFDYSIRQTLDMRIRKALESNFRGM